MTLGYKVREKPTDTWTQQCGDLYRQPSSAQSPPQDERANRDRKRSKKQLWNIGHILIHLWMYVCERAYDSLRLSVSVCDTATTQRQRWITLGVRFSVHRLSLTWPSILERLLTECWHWKRSRYENQSIDVNIGYCGQGKRENAKQNEGAGGRCVRWRGGIGGVENPQRSN